MEKLHTSTTQEQTGKNIIASQESINNQQENIGNTGFKTVKELLEAIGEKPFDYDNPEDRKPKRLD